MIIGKNSDHKPLYILAFTVVLAIYLFLVFFSAAKGPSIKQDDHWYMNDVRTFLSTGRMQSNQVFPAMLVQEKYNPPPVLHNLPLMYAVMPFAMLFGVYWGWIAANIIFNLLTCLLLILLIRKLKGSILQCLIFTSMFLLWIMTVHIAAHPMAEAGVVFFLTCLVLCYFYLKGKLSDYVVLAALTALTVLNRPSFYVLPILILIDIWIRKEERRLLKTFIYLVTFGAVVFTGYLLMPQLHFGLLAPLKMPDNQAMLHHFALNQIGFSVVVFLQKVLSAITLQLLGRNLFHTVFVTLFNLFVLGFLLFRFSTAEKRQNRFFRITFFLLLTYFATLVWFQYQTRFLQTVMPFLLAWFALVLLKIKKHHLYISFVVLFCLINLTGSIYYAIQNRQNAELTSQIETSYNYIKDKYNPQGSILVTGNSKLIPWVFKDSKYLLMVDDKISSREDLLWMRSKIRYDWLLCENDSVILDSLAELKPRFIEGLPPPMSEFALYQIQEGRISKTLDKGRDSDTNTSR